MSDNRLRQASSPYLQQHADNPVAWQPWDEAALQLAREQQKPILLSIGYSACHWCHVMAHESFEDEETAALMNRWFVNIKVDREERPDLDKIYQAAYQLMNRQGGGWPLTVFLTPDEQVPFFSGTYFPPKAAYGRPAFRDVLRSVAEAWEEKRQDILDHNQQILAAMTPATADDRQQNLSLQPLQKALEVLQQVFDPVRGGFSQAPKFPHPDMLDFVLLAYHRNPEQATVLEMATVTADHMALGGINDALGGGFCRYSTDNDWMIPHFEKMLYDNGPLLSFYANLFQITGASLYQQAAGMTAEWVCREMQAESGGYYSSLDADSEGREGQFYVWTPGQVKGLLSEPEYALVAERFSLNQPANFEGAWHLHCDAGRQPATLETEQQALWESARNKLFQAREQRVHPGLDDKILTSWNALMIRGMSQAAAVFGRNDWLESARRAIDFILAHCWKNQRLRAVCKDGESHLNAYLDDYAFLIDALLTFVSVRWDNRYFIFATELAEVLVAHYHDRESGGFFFTSDEHENLIQRPKTFQDEAMPSGNGIACRALLRLGYLSARTDLISVVEQTLKAAQDDMQRYPHAHCSLLAALEEFFEPPEIIILRGEEAAMQNWRKLQTSGWQPHRMVFSIPALETGLPEVLAEKQPAGELAVYRCQGMNCTLA